MQEPADRRHTLMRILLHFFLSLFSGLTISSVLMIALMDDMGDRLYLQILISQMGLFIIPVVLFGILEYKKDFASKFMANRWPGFKVLSLSILAIVSSFFFVQFLYKINKMLPLPEWMTVQEADKMNLTEEVLNMTSTPDLMINLLIIGLLPALGEEFLFRGVIQKYIIQFTKKPWLGILVTAAVFSAIHFQFQGFIPRMVLGVLLGYLYWISRSIWLPVIVHFFNNAYQIILHYMFLTGESELNLLEDITVEWHTALISGGITAVLLIYLHQHIKKASDLLL